MLLFRNIRKAEGEAEGCHCDNCSFISMLVCYLFLRFPPPPPLPRRPSLFGFLLLLFFFYLHLREQVQYEWNILLHYLFVFAFVCSGRAIVRSIIFCAGRDRFLKATQVGLFHCDVAVNNHGATRNWFHE